MAQHIEFYLHPPSPKQSVTRLPPVSSLLQQQQQQQQQEDTMSSSCSLSSLSSYNSTDYLPSISNLTSSLSNHSISETTSLPSLSPIMNSLSLVDSPPSWLLLPPINRSRSLSISSNHSHDPVIFEEVDTKRKRGRPPNQSKQHVHRRDSYTFVTPTVCNIQPHREIKQVEDPLVLHWPQQQQQEKNGENIFTHTALTSIPKKKRGRKPKMQLAGNFCFVWRDLTARRGANNNNKSKK